jgi:putative ABC transport system permease protein
MKPIELLRIASEALQKNKVRSLLTMLGIIIGVSAVIIMIAISAGTEATIKEQIEGLGTNLLYVRGGFAMGGNRSVGPSSGGLVYDDAWAIQDQVSGVIGVVVDQSTSSTVKSETAALDDITITGTSPDFPSVRDFSIAEGRFFNMTDLERKKKVAILGSDLAIELFGTTDPLGQTITVGSTKLAVIGIMESKGTVGNVDYDSQLFIPITVLFQKFVPTQFSKIIGDRVNQIVVEIDEDHTLEAIQNQITLLLAKRHEVSTDDADFSISTQEDIIATRESTTAAFRSLLSWVAGVSLIVGGIGIMNIMMVSVTERTREIGIRQSVGATPNDIRLQFLTEALLLSLIGGLIGVVAGVGGSYIFGAVSDMRTVVVPSSILLAFASAAAVGIFFGFFPANQASQLDPIDALRYE